MNTEKFSSLVGRLCAVAILSFATGLTAFSVFQLDFWQHYFFFDSPNAFTTCEVSAVANADENPNWDVIAQQPKKTVKVPHSINTILATVTRNETDFVHANYECRFHVAGSTNAKDQISYLHLGWFHADSTEVLLDGRQITAFNGSDKLSLPLPRTKVGVDLNLTIRGTTKNRNYFGLLGKTPIVISTGNQINNKVFGLEFGLQQVRTLYNLLPTLTVALFLIVAWFFGFRSQLVALTLGFFVVVIMRNLLLLLSEFWPWQLVMTYRLAAALQLGTIVFFVLFALELLEYKQRLIPRLLFIGLLLMIAEPCYNLAAEYYGLKLLPIEDTNYFASIAACMFLIYAERKNRNKFSTSRQKINWTFVVVTSSLSVLMLIDYLFIYLEIPVRLALKIELIMPLFVGGTVFYTLSLIEKEFREEKASRAILERDLEVAREIQDSLSSPQQQSFFDRFKINCYQRKHQKVAGDWLAIKTSEKEVVIVVADATGKGMQAALVIHAIQSLWAQRLDDETFDAGVWLETVNKTLKRLGQRQTHSATIGVVILRPDDITYWSCGHLPLFIAEHNATMEKPKIKSMNARGSIVGISSEFNLEPAKLSLDPESSYAILLGTDGVFANATRTKPSEVAQILASLRQQGQQFVETSGDDDDRTVVFIDTAQT